MLKRIVFLGGGILAASLGMSIYAQPPDAHAGHEHKESGEGKQVTVVGELIDTACFVASDGDAKGQDHAACAKECMRSGVPAGILPDGAKDAHEMMYLLTNSTVLTPYAAKTIKVEGKAYENMHAIDVQKIYVKDGDNWKEIQLSDAHHKMGGGAEEKHDDHHEHK